ncbi:MAG: hypothetical protein HY360_03880 [Verrucomicrobia bacterium]|nr:hypothetical protein [Verrucomicrobiota bacterium]
MTNGSRLPLLLEPAIFWLWNATPAPEDIRGRLDDFAAKGIRAVYIHPMPQAFRPEDFFAGMEIPYLSEAFFERVVFTCDEMRRRGMRLWLYDEGGWPSGVADGAVVAENPDYGVWALARRDGRIAPVQFLSQIAFPDLMNPTATGCFIRTTHEAYRRHLGAEFGKTVLGIFTDEPRLMGRVGTDTIPWSPLLPEVFAAEHGYKLDAVVDKLFQPDPVGEKVWRIRRQYLRTISNLVAKNYYQPIRVWCERWGLLFEGHHAGENEFSRHGQHFGNYLEQARHYHVPGVDAIWRDIFPGKATGNYVGLAASSAWLRGERCAVSESFSVYGAGLTLAQMKWIAAFQIVRGVNKIAMMGSLQSAAGARRIGVCSDLSPTNPIWRNVDLLVDFIRRAADFSVRGQVETRAGVLYRAELVPENEAAVFDQLHERLCDCIQDRLVGMLFVDMEHLQRGRMMADGLALDHATLAVLIIHSVMPFDEDERAVLGKLAQDGLRILSVGPALLGEGRIEKVAAPEEISLAGLSAVVTDRKLCGVRLLAHRDGDRLGLLFFNQNASPVKFSFAAGCGLAEVLLEDPVATLLHPLASDGSGYRLHLEAGQMRAFESIKTSENRAPNQWRIAQQYPLDVKWKIREEERFVIADDTRIEQGTTQWAEGSLGDYCAEYPGFSGSLVYQASFKFEAQPQSRVLLDLGTVFYAAEVFLNGVGCGRRAWVPFLFDLTPALRSGHNLLQVRITNTLANQWAAPQNRTRDFRLWRNVYLERATSFVNESLHGGLGGPVRLIVAVTVNDHTSNKIHVKEAL